MVRLKNMQYFLFVALAGLIMISCEKKSSSNVVDEEDGGVKLQFVVSSVEEFAVEEAKTASVSRKASGVTTPQIESFEGFDAVAVSYDEDSDLKYEIADKRAATFNAGNKYRVVLYEVSGTNETYVGQYVLTSGDNTSTIPVNYNRTYKWYAISYNSSEVPAEVTDPTSPSPTFNFANRDVLYASGQVTTSVLGNNPLGIKFRRLGSRIDVVFNAVGMSAWVLDQINVDLNVKQGVFNLKTGALVSSSNLTVNKANTDFTYVDASFQDIAAVSVYTVGNESLGTFTPSLKKFRVVQHNSLTTSDSDAYIFGNGSSVIGSWNFSIGTPVKAKYYPFTINLVQAPITIGGVRFARGNIYDTDNANSQASPVRNAANMRRYKLRKQNANVNNYWIGANYHYTDYFRFGDSRAGSAPPLLGSFFNTAADGLDPCNFLYPYDTWKTPTSNELAVLSSASGKTFTSNYMEVPGTGPANSPYPSNNLRLEKKGMFENLLASSPYIWNSGTHRYWSTTNEGIWIIIGNIDWYYYAEMGSNSYNVPAAYNGLGQWAQHNHYPIRCVRK